MGRVQALGGVSNPPRFFKEDCTKIKLSRDKFALIDPIDSHLSVYRWHYSRDGYAARNLTRENGRRSKIYLHHAIMGRPLRGMEIDHKNGNRLDDRRQNLRIVSHRQNGQNRLDGREDGFIGITNSYGRWKARISINGKRVELGRFNTREEAYQAYLKKCRELDRQ